MKLQTLSASRIKTFKTCAKQYYYKYIMPHNSRPLEDKNIGALLGTALHKAIEQRYRNNASPIQVFQQVMSDTMDQWEQENVTIKGIEWLSKSTKTGRLILKEFPWDLFIPIELEYEFILPFPNQRHPIVLMNGYIDMITADGWVVDHKSQQKAPTQDQLDNDSQFIIYAWAYREIYGILPERVIWNHVRTNTQVDANVLNDFDIKLDKLIEDINAVLEPKVYYGRRLMDKVCMDDCSFYTQCYGIKNKNRITVEDLEVD